LLSAGSAWLAVVVAINAVLGLAYYVPAVAALFTPAEGPADAAAGTAPGARRPACPVTAALGAVTIAAVLVGFAPQWVLDLADYFPRVAVELLTLR
jgi:NADH-quinone oxidoreductase subunit N